MGSGAVVCTVAEGNYHFGVAALCNSLYRHGYRGEVWVGWRGALPDWAADAIDNGTWKEVAVDAGLSVRFIEIAGTEHLTNCKPRFLRQILVDLAPNAGSVFYFDSDVVVLGDWSFFEEWVSYGVALMQDVWDTAMLPCHVFKRRWRAHAMALGYQCREMPGYYNGGFVGVGRDDIRFLEVWEDIVASIVAAGGDLTSLKMKDPNHLFFRMDQDALNAAVLATDVEIATGSKEMMEYFPWAAVIAHAIDFKKPWRRNYLVDAVQGYPPGRPHLAYWQNAEGPIAAYSRRRLTMKRLEIGIARAIGRLHHRSLNY